VKPPGRRGPAVRKEAAISRTGADRLAGHAAPVAGRGSAGRVIAGTARGTRLLAPGEGTRPLADRVKETLFAILEPALREALVLDLFAGSGAGGIEALSRGARGATFVERDAGAVRTLVANLERAHLAGPAAVVVRGEAISWLGTAAAGGPPPAGPFSLALVDPPYDEFPALLAALERLGRPGSPLGRGAIVVAKHFWRNAPPPRIGLLASERTRRFGETALTFYRLVEGTEAQA
jgi:16S rRNA (guanine966-N2)-methyltransferase